ncbi:MAG: UDP-3-O-[3-hydroxymyristoyl] N-acetylglucosamine deacetylase [Proteobacteria bacterium]|nr:UDP-3-O-[3-hydroxymyristoyl] N-acetylglucosamine deacetylase [Pseudomonadota bacterium]
MQHTLKTATSTIEGVGLHTGATVALRILPAVPDTGIRFVRTDLRVVDSYVPAIYDAVDTSASRLCTMLRNATGVTVQTPEHLMAALAGCGIDNALIEINGPEVPLMDGSSKLFAEAILQAGRKIQPGSRAAIRILKPVQVVDGDKKAEFIPTERPLLEIDFSIEFPGLGSQRRQFVLDEPETFTSEIAPARTFTLRSIAEAMKARGAVKGGSLENALVLNDEDGTPYQGQFMNGWQDEPVRHKILDAVGDLALAGMPIYGRLVTERGGHALTNTLLRALFDRPDAFSIVRDIAGIPISGVEKRLAGAEAH